jgi:hypothetical protein
LRFCAFKLLSFFAFELLNLVRLIRESWYSTFRGLNMLSSLMNCGWRHMLAFFFFFIEFPRTFSNILFFRMEISKTFQNIAVFAKVLEISIEKKRMFENFLEGLENYMKKKKNASMWRHPKFIKDESIFTLNVEYQLFLNYPTNLNVQELKSTKA